MRLLGPLDTAVLDPFFIAIGQLGPAALAL